MAAATTACSAVGVPPTACTEIGAAPGLAVTVERGMVQSSAPSLALTICQDACTEHEVSLQPGSTTVGATCSPGGPDSTCSASSSPDGTWVGFVDLSDLAAGDVRVSGTLGDGERIRQLAEVTVRAEVTYPNGPQCPPENVQAQVQVTEDGLR